MAKEDNKISSCRTGLKMVTLVCHCAHGKTEHCVLTKNHMKFSPFNHAGSSSPNLTVL